LREAGLQDIILKDDHSKTIHAKTNLILLLKLEEEFEDTKGAIRIRISENK
jgi:hypothetical protein